MKSQNINIQDFLVDYGERLRPEEVKSAQKYKTVKDLLQGFADKKETSINLFDVSVFFGAEDDWDDDPCPDKLFAWVYHVAHGFDLQDLYEYFMGFEVSEEMLPDLASRLLA